MKAEPTHPLPASQARRHVTERAVSHNAPARRADNRATSLPQSFSNCHPERSEESRINFRPMLLNGTGQRCFAALNMTARVYAKATQASVCIPPMKQVCVFEGSAELRPVPGPTKAVR